MRALVLERRFDGEAMAAAALLNALYFTAAAATYWALLRSARRAGTLLTLGE